MPVGESQGEHVTCAESKQIAEVNGSLGSHAQRWL